MKYFILAFGVFLLCCCSGSNPTEKLLKRKIWVNENLSSINNLIIDFQKFSAEKIVWSSAGYITLIDSKGCVMEGGSIAELISCNNCTSPAWKEVGLERFIKKSNELGVNGVYYSVYLYIEFKDGFVLVIDGGEMVESMQEIEPTKSVIEVRRGWFLFFDK